MNFIIIFIVVVLALILLGGNLYKNTRYATFDIEVAGKVTLAYAPLSLQSPQMITPSSHNSSTTSYRHLSIAWWGDRVPAYKIDGNQIWFKVNPTFTGDFVLVNPQAGTPLANENFEILDENARKVQTLLPGHLYKVSQYGKWYTIKFNWD